MGGSDIAGRAPRRRRGPVHRAAYGTSRVLGEVEFLTARFGDHRFAPHSHPVFAVGCVQHGACRIWHRGASHLAGPGDLILINPGDPHSAEPATHDAWDYCALYFSAATAARWLPELASVRRGLALRGVVVHEPMLAACLTALCQALESDPEDAGGEAPFAALVGALFQRFGHAPDTRANQPDAESSERVRQYLDDNFSSQVRIESLADLVGLSPFRVIRSFTDRFGMPPYTYLLHVRVERARAMLKAGHPITDTAMSVGFSDQSHLTRFFRRIIGVPPGLYARGVAAGHCEYAFGDQEHGGVHSVGRPVHLIRA